MRRLALRPLLALACARERPRRRPDGRAPRLLAAANGCGSRPRCRSRGGVGVQLATTSGRPLGWIAEPQRRRFLSLRWNGRLQGKRVPDGRYLVRLVDGTRTVASSPLRIDQTAPRAMTLRAHNRSREPFQGDGDRVTTISPNGDGLRDSAKISFTLSERARVQFEVTRRSARR